MSTTTHRDNDVDASPTPRAGRLERPAGRLPSPRAVFADLGSYQVVNGVIGVLFSITGPIPIIVAVGRGGGLSAEQIASWIFGVLAFNGLLTIVMSWTFRQPLGFFWTIPGTVVVGTALQSLTWPEVIGAYVLTALLVLAIGLTGKVDRVMSLLPMPVVMAMVAGVFLGFGIDLVTAVENNAAIAAPMVAIFFLATALPSVARFVPPILGALAVGVVGVLATGAVDGGTVSGPWLAAPVFTAPQFTWSAAIELVIPLALTVVVVQNGQGMAVLREVGHRPPMNLVTVVCGLVSLPAAMVGAVSTCLTGPTNALLTASGQRRRHYTAALVCGALAIIVGLLAPGFVRLLLAVPVAFVAALGGLAMLRALEGAFRAAFSGGHVLAALITFLVTVAEVTFLNIGAAFWGLVVGVAVHILLARGPQS
ncbi:benzoate/H(+) symporter BenE family transporter [Knoellia sp. S7-12]|uniref:benzoate/H(+) symporter BenE family transporter n=1 Tax=Knoellia sp. S7-12 TaxID=3126698 RepID=UPI003366043A